MDIEIWTDAQITANKDSFISLLYGEYEREMKRFSFLKSMGSNEFRSFLDQRIMGNRMAAGFENGKLVGVLMYGTGFRDGEKYIHIPAYAYGAENERKADIIGRLFQHLADKEVGRGATNFSVHIYAHDESVWRLFSFMQFGTISERGVRKLPERQQKLTRYRVRNLTKEEIAEEWGSLWPLTQRIIDHLKESPIFYLGIEFTEEGYRAFYMEQSTTVYAAYDHLGKMIGVIETNEDADGLVFSRSHSVNVGEAFVLPEYRGSGLAQDLLSFAEQYVSDRGADYMWVEHGTANPNARGFWNKYFETYQYELIRRIVR